MLKNILKENGYLEEEKIPWSLRMALIRVEGNSDRWMRVNESMSFELYRNIFLITISIGSFKYRISTGILSQIDHTENQVD